jgi:5-formyltetrahydrofolate cyclo-ligase
MSDLPRITAAMPGNEAIADELVELYLAGKKTAGSGLVKDYETAGDPLPKVGDQWTILDSRRRPRATAKTVRVEIHRFRDVPVEIAIAEGEGDLSLDYWREA